MLKQFLAFMGDCYYPSSGMGDFFGDFDTLEDAVETLTTNIKTRKFWDNTKEYAEIWDSQIRKNVWDDNMLLD